jgi:TnpA family transposase
LHRCEPCTSVLRLGSEHQRWAREHAGFVLADDTILGELASALKELSYSAASVDDLRKQAELWLYGRNVILLGERALCDAAREAFAAQEAAAVEAVRKGVTPKHLVRALTRVFSKRKGRTGGTVLEWLRTPPGKHGAATLKETTLKVAYLKSLAAHEWDLSGIALPRLQAYSQAVVHRPPSDTARLSEDQRTLEVACFLVATLLELTDLTVDIAGRRVCDFVRKAKAGVQEQQARSSVDLRTERNKVRELLYAAALSSDEKIAALQKLIPPEPDKADGSRAALVRQALVGDNQRVTTLLNSLAIFELRGDESQRELKQVGVLRDLAQRGVRQLPQDFDVSITDPVWHHLLKVTDRAKALSALKACAITSIGRGIKGGKLWLDHSWRHRNREEQLIPLDEWKEKRTSIIRDLSLTDDPQKYLDRVFEQLRQCLVDLEKAVEDGDVTIDEAGRVHLPKMEAMDVDPDVDRTRDAMYEIIGPVQNADLLVEIDARTGFSKILLGRPGNNAAEVVAVYGALLAHGTENDAKGVAAMVPDLEVSQITSAMRAIEAQGRLRRANDVIVEFQQSFEIARLWGSGQKGSADSMSLDTSQYLHAARMEHRRKQPAVGVYTHIMDSYGLFYDQPIVLNVRQAAGAVHGVEYHNATRGEDRIRLSLLAVDTHGYTNAAMSVAKLLGLDLCVWLRNLPERKLYLPSAVKAPESLERVRTDRASVRKVKKGWDALLRLIASIRRGKLTAKDALERLGSAAEGDELYAAADELGKMLRTIFLCDFFTKPELRRELRTLLNRGESIHQLQRAVHRGRVGHQRGRRREELVAISGANTLLTNAVIAWNTMKMQEVTDDWEAKKHRIEKHWLRRMGPGHFAHINFKGTIAFNVDPYADVLLQGSERNRARAQA